MRLLLFSNIKGPDSYLPLNLLSLASYAEMLGHQVDVVDGQVESNWLDRCLSLAESADVIGLSSYTGPSINGLLVLQRALRERGVKRPTIWGGYHGTLAHQKILQEGWADFVVRGYGEHALAGILDHLQGKCDREQIANITYRTSDGDVVAGPRRKIDFLDELPSVNYDFVDVAAYFTPERRIVQYISSYGCPYACTFCAEPVHSGRRWRGFSVDRVVHDMQAIQQRYQPDRISFVDPNMSSQPGRIVALANALIEQDSPIEINCNMRSRDVLEISRALPIDRLYQAGFRRIFIGVESGDDGQLKQLKKSAVAEDHYRAITALDAAGIEVQMSFIHDLPEESDEQAEATLELAERLLEVRTPNSNQSHHFYMPYPGTELFDSMGSTDLDFSQVSQDDWARTSTFKSNDVWRGNARRRSWTIDRLGRLHDRNPAVLPAKELSRLRESTAMDHDYVDRFLL